MKRRLNSRLIGILFLVGFISNIQLVHAQDNAIDWFKQGAEATGNQEKINCYLQAIKLNPKFIEAYYNLGYVYKNAGDLDNAEKAFRQALLTAPMKLNIEDKLRITYELGMTLKKLNRYDEAIETLEGAKNLARQTEIRAAILYELGRTKLLLGNFEEAVAEFSEGLQLNSSKQSAFESAVQNARSMQEIEAEYVKGISYLNNGQYEEAIATLNRVINSSPNYKNSNQKLAEAQQLKERKTTSDNLADIYARGIGYMQRNDWSNAIIAFKQVEQADPNYKEVKIKIAESQTKLDQSLEEEVYEKIYNDGMSEYRKGNWINAIIALEKVKEWRADYKNTDRMYRDAQSKLNREGEDSAKNRYYVQGKNYLNNGDWELAIATFKQLKNLDQNYRDVQFLLKQAEDGLAEAAKSPQLENYYIDAMKYYNDGDWLKAILVFEKIQQINPGFKDVSEKLTQAQNNVNQPKVAQTVKKSKEAKTGTNHWMLIGGLLSVLLIPTAVAFFAVPTARAKWLLMQGNYQKAALIYESILIRKPDKVKLYPLLANVYLMLNRPDDTARKVYDIVLQMNISPKLRQRLDATVNQQFLNNKKSENQESLEEKLKRELFNLKNT